MCTTMRRASGTEGWATSARAAVLGALELFSRTAADLCFHPAAHYLAALVRFAPLVTLAGRIAPLQPMDEVVALVFPLAAMPTLSVSFGLAVSHATLESVHLLRETCPGGGA